MTYTVMTKDMRTWLTGINSRCGDNWFTFREVADILPDQHVLLKMWHRGFLYKEFKDLHTSRTIRKWKINPLTARRL